jgi:hypothetical protein
MELKRVTGFRSGECRAKSIRSSFIPRRTRHMLSCMELQTQPPTVLTEENLDAVLGRFHA